MNADGPYFYERAVQEIEMAQKSQHPSAVAAHYELAERYLARVYGHADEQQKEGAG